VEWTFVAPYLYQQIFINTQLIGPLLFIKKSRDQYEMRIHKRLIDILSPSSKVIDALMELTLPAGVDIEIKMI